MVWVVLFSGYMIDEPASPRQKVACTLIILGQITVAVFGDHTTKSDVTVQEVVGIRSADFSSSYFTFRITI